MNFSVRLPLFEGPFDLLLFFIQRDEIDIGDIPISQITNDFLGYIKQLESMNIEVASEFMVVASQLIRIKSKMLLPSRPSEEDEEEDPRQQLATHLAVYKHFKELSQDLSDFEDLQIAKYPRANATQELETILKIHQTEVELKDMNGDLLFKVFNHVLEKKNFRESRQKTHKVINYPYTVAGQKKWLSQLIYKKERISFIELMEQSTDRMMLIFNFMALLEMLNLKDIYITLGEGFNNFWLYYSPPDKT